MKDMQATVYYAKSCQFSQDFLRALDALPDLRETLVLSPVERGGFPPSLRMVPAVLESDSLYQGREAFEWLKKKKLMVPSPFSYDNSGPSPTVEYSFLGEEVAYGHRQNAFESFDCNDVTSGHQAESSSGPLEALMEKRRQEVPQQISRT